MKIRLINARLLTLEEGMKITFGELEVTDNLITYVGPMRSGVFNFDRVIDCEGNLLMPGFKNAHTHSAMTFLRSYADDDDLHTWLNEKVFPMEAKLQPGDEYHLSKVAFLEYLTSGITACFDMYYNPKATAKAALDLGFRVVLLGTVTRFKESVEEMIVAYHELNQPNSLVSYRLGFHAIYTASEEILTELAKAVQQLKVPIYTHLAETQAEVDDCLATHKMTPAQYIDSFGLFDYGGGGFHCIYLHDVDVEIFKKHRLFAVTNPSSNIKLASGIAPLHRYVEAGIPVAIGTDGPASNNALDFFREMFLVTGLSKIVANDPRVIDAYVVLKMATLNGADAMGLTKARTLSVGQLADIILLDLKQPNMQPLNNIVKNIVYAGSKTNVKMTMINGKILYEDGQFFVGEDVEQIYQKAQAVTERLKAAV
jgi:5-methylthioadenosine/S-adenosylhomocysteine deaminase